MKRRDALKVFSGALLAGTAQAAPVKTVLVMFKCHLDVGFTDTQAGVMKKYFNVHYPAAIKRAADLRETGDRYVWTTGSWLLYEYLEQAGAADRKTMEDAIARGDIAWHALPFSWQTEFMDRSLISACIGFSKSLDARFGRTTTGAKMTDVPGHTIGLVAPLAENGVKFLHIGVNSASTPPETPDLFVWKDRDGQELIVMYQHKGYGGVIEVPGSGVAIAVEMADDNLGPHSPKEIHDIYAALRAKYPGAEVRAGNLTDIAGAADAHRGALPVLTGEIGDTWIHGVPSDPIKVARYRELARLRREWIAAGRFNHAGEVDLAFLRRFALCAEHTWGTDTKTYLDNDHYKPSDLDEALERSGYQKMVTSWAEKRRNVDDAVAGLPTELRPQAVARLAKLRASVPETESLDIVKASQEFETAHFTVAIDEKTGAIRKLRAKAANRDWASPDHPLALFTYQTFSAADFAKFLNAYVKSKADWAPRDFGKPNIERFNARSAQWTPELARLWFEKTAAGCRLLARLRINDLAAEKSGTVAWPKTLYLDLDFPDAEPLVNIDFSCFGKVANRLPEAMWLTFQPDAPDPRGWRIEKSDYEIDPFEVVRGGNRHLHALSRGLRYRDAEGSLAIDTLDAPVIAIGEKSTIRFSNDPPDFASGVHVSLFNNTWGTNYIQWFGEDTRFRFTLRA